MQWICAQFLQVWAAMSKRATESSRQIHSGKKIRRSDGGTGCQSIAEMSAAGAGAAGFRDVPEVFACTDGDPFPVFALIAAGVN